MLQQSLVARTPIHQWHFSHGARFAEIEGWQTVATYTEADREAAAARVAMAVADISNFAKVSLRGQGVPSVIEALAPGSKATKALGVSSVADADALACRLSDDHLMLLAEKSAVARLRTQLACPIDGQSIVQTDVTSAYAGFVVLGQFLEDLLRRLTHLDLRATSFPIETCAETAFARVEALLVRRAEFCVPSLRIYVPWDLGEYVWTRMLEAGSDYSITPIGLEALQLLSMPRGTTSSN